MKTLNKTFLAMRRTPYQTLVALLVTSVTFFIGYLLSFAIIGTETILRYFETQPQVIAFFKTDTKDDRLLSIKDELLTLSYVKSIDITSQADALAWYKKEHENKQVLLDMITPEIFNPSLDISGVTLDALPQINEQVKKYPEINEVVFQQDLLAIVQKWTKTIRFVGIGSIAVLSILALLVIGVITGLKISSQRQKIGIMKLLGASGWFVRMPYVLEGSVYGFFGSLTGWAIAYLCLLYATPQLNEFIKPIPLFPIPILFFAKQLGIGLGLGLILGGLASTLAVNRMLSKQ